MVFTNALNASNNDFEVSSGTLQRANRTLLRQAAASGGYVENLGITIAGGVITLKGGDGNDLSATNPCIACVENPTTGSMLLVKSTSNWSFEDDVGTSDIVGNTFGTTASVAWGYELPMYIYLVVNNAGDTVKPMLSRKPHHSRSCAVAVLGAPDDAVADTDNAFWCFEAIDETLYDDNPCICVGSIKAIKSASDDWTFSALDSQDGIGHYNEETAFAMAQGQNGAAAGTYILATAGTEPEFTQEIYWYRILRNGYMWLHFDHSNATVSGVGANPLAVVFPLTTSNTNRPLNLNCVKLDGGSAYYTLSPWGGDSTGLVYFLLSGSFVAQTLANFTTTDELYFQGWVKLGPAVNGTNPW